jgi:magnesium transporter
MARSKGRQAGKDGDGPDVGATRNSPESEAGMRIRLFDADRTDKALTFDEAMRKQASERQLLWIDVEGKFEDGARKRLVEHFELDERTVRVLAKANGRPRVRLHGRHFVVRVAAEVNPTDPDEVGWLDIIAGKNVVITRHDGPVEVLESMNERIGDDATIGVLDSAEFVAALAEAILTGFHEAVDRIEDELDEFDEQALARSEPRELFGRLVAIRRRIGRLRRLFASHRELFGALGSPDFARGVEPEDPEVFVHLMGRYEGVLTSLESTRQVVLGSFDIVMNRTAQRTNDIVRVLTVATVLAIPATITAGFLGMNLIVPLPSDDPGAFWVVVGIVALIEGGLIALARWRGWL